MDHSRFRVGMKSSDYMDREGVSPDRLPKGEVGAADSRASRCVLARKAQGAPFGKCFTGHTFASCFSMSLLRKVHCTWCF